MSDCKNNIKGTVVITEPQQSFCGPCGTDGCLETLDASCVIYHEDNSSPSQLVNINVSNGTSVEDILEIIDDMIGNSLNIPITEIDTLTVNLTANGPAKHTLRADVNISSFFNNAIQVFPDGLYVPNSFQNSLIYGGVVTWLGDFNFNISEAGYYLNGVFYESPETNVTLSAPDGTFDRIDAFILDDTGTASVLEGIPAEIPQQPGVDIGKQLIISFALVETGTTEVNITQECIYLENTEWTGVANSPNIDLASATTPCEGALGIEGTNVTNNNNVVFTRPGGVFEPTTSYTILTLLISPKPGWGLNDERRLALQWRDGGTPLGTEVIVGDGDFGFDISDTACQVVSIPLYFFNLPIGTEVDELVLRALVTSASFGFFVDKICLQSIPINPPSISIYTLDTETVDLSGDGSIDSPLFADVNISDLVNNAIQVYPDGLYVPNLLSNALVYGGVVTWVQDYDYHVTAAGYYLNGVFYESPAADFTLSPPDGTFDRIDAFIVDNTGVASVLEGTPSAVPAQPGIALGEQLLLSFALVQTGTTDPGISQECIYLENTEWTTVPSAGTINPNSTNNPYSGTKTIEGTSVTNAQSIEFQRPGGTFTPVPTYSVLTLKIRSKGGWGNNRKLLIHWLLGGNKVGGSVYIGNGLLGFNQGNTSTYQTISIPLSSFGLINTTSVDGIFIQAENNNGSFGWYIDEICLQGVPVAPPPSESTEFRNALTRTANIVEWGGANPLLHDTDILMADYTVKFSQDVNNYLQYIGFTGKLDMLSTNGNFVHTFAIDAVGGLYTEAVNLLATPNVRGLLAVDATSSYLELINPTGITGLLNAWDGSVGYSLLAAANPYVGIYLDPVAGIRIGKGPAVNNRNIEGIQVFPTKEIRINNYPNSRNDGLATKFLTTDGDGDLELREVDFSSVGTLTSFTFNDGNGFDGTVTNPTTTPALTLTTTLTQGSVVFIGTGGALNEDNTNFFWNDTDNRLGINTNVPDTSLHIVGQTLDINTTSATAGFGTYGIHAGTTLNVTAGTTFTAGYLYGAGSNNMTYNANTSKTIANSVVVAGQYNALVLGGTSSTTTDMTQGVGGGLRAMAAQANIVIMPVLGAGISPVISHVANTHIKPVQQAAGADWATITNYYQLLIGNSEEGMINTASTVNKWGIYQNGTNDINFFAAETRIGASTDAGDYILQVTGGVYEDVTGKTMRYVGLSTDNTATQVLAKNGSGNNVWRDTSTLTEFTADNGLTKNTSTNVRWGGSLIQNTTISASTFLTLFTGSTTASNGVVEIVNSSSTGRGMRITTSGGTAIRGEVTGANVVASFARVASTTNSIVAVLDVNGQTSGTAAAGLGTSIDMYTEIDAGGSVNSTRLASIWTSPVSGAEYSRFSIRNQVDGTLHETATFSGTQTTILSRDAITAQTSERYSSIGTYKTLTDATATSFVRINIPTGQVSGGEILITVEANDATDFQARTLRFIWSAVNKAGTITANVATPEESVAVSTGTLTVTIDTNDAGSGNLDFRANATSSLTETVLRCTYQVLKNFGTGAITPQ